MTNTYKVYHLVSIPVHEKIHKRFKRHCGEENLKIGKMCGTILGAYLNKVAEEEKESRKPAKSTGM